MVIGARPPREVRMRALVGTHNRSCIVVSRLAKMTEELAQEETIRDLKHKLRVLSGNFDWWYHNYVRYSKNRKFKTEFESWYRFSRTLRREIRHRRQRKDPLTEKHFIDYYAFINATYTKVRAFIAEMEAEWEAKKSNKKSPEPKLKVTFAPYDVVHMIGEAEKLEDSSTESDSDLDMYLFMFEQ